MKHCGKSPSSSGTCKLSLYRLCTQSAARALYSHISKTLTGALHVQTLRKWQHIKGYFCRCAQCHPPMHNIPSTRAPSYRPSSVSIPLQCSLFKLSVVCAGPVPVAPAVGAVLHYLCLVPWRHGVRCGACLVSWLAACTAAWLGGCCLRLVQRCWPGLVGWRFSYASAFGGFLP